MDLSSPAIFIGKQGNGVISFGSGQPDLPPPRAAIDDVNLRDDLRYGLIQGELDLRQAIAKDYPCSHADEFIITNGASEALDLVFRAFGKGKVLVPRPYYYSYPYNIEFAGMEIVYTDTVNGKTLKQKLKIAWLC
jgi:aspartate/methionine/tyrosine aminotransferase